MPTYVRFEKKTSRGVLAHDVALEGKILHQRTRAGQNKKTGRVGGGLSRSTTAFRNADAAQAKHDEIVRDLLARRYLQVGGPKMSASAAASPPKRAIAKKSAKGIVAKGTAKPSSGSAVAAFEQQCGFRLPASYRRFVTKHGAGELLGFVRIHAPRTSGRYRLDTLARLLSTRSPDGDSPARSRALRTFVAFADTTGGDLLGWNLGAHVRARTEPPVYLLERNGTRPRKVAASFAELCDRLGHDPRFVDRLFLGLEPDPTYVMK